MFSCNLQVNLNYYSLLGSTRAFQAIKPNALFYLTSFAAMFSQRLCLLIEKTTTLGRFFRSCVLCFNRKTLKYYNTKNQTVYLQMRRNLVLSHIWMFLALYIPIKLRKENDIENYNICLFFWIGLSSCVFIYSAYNIVYDDLAYVAQGTVRLYFQLQGKTVTRFITFYLSLI